MQRYFPQLGTFLNQLIAEGYEFIVETDNKGKITKIHSDAFHRGKFKRAKARIISEKGKEVTVKIK